MRCTAAEKLILVSYNIKCVNLGIIIDLIMISV